MNSNRVVEPRSRLCIVMPHHWSVVLGGAEYQAHCLTRELLRSAKYQVTMISRVAPPEPARGDIEVIGIGDSPQRPRLGYLADAMPLYGALNRIRPAVIYQRVGCGYTAIAAHYARRHGIPMILHASSDTDVSPYTLVGSTNMLTRRLEKLSVEFGIRHAHKIICQTHQQARLLEHHYGRQAAAVIPNFHPAPLEEIDKTGPMTVLWVANLKRLKQPELFVQLAGSLRDLRHVRFVMIGSLSTGSRRDRGWHERLFMALHETPNLQYVGAQSQAQVNDWLARSHLLVSTSSQEGFPNTFIQAWMREVPVVSLHVNPDDVLDREAIGRCAHAQGELVEAVRDLLLDEGRREQYGQAARRYALQHHSLQNAQRVEQLIDECLAGYAEIA